MVSNCCVKNCTNTWFPGTNLTYHTFGKKRLEKWRKVVPSKNAVGPLTTICSAHFDNADFITSGTKRTLKSTALPRHFGNEAKKKKLFDELRTDQNNTASQENMNSFAPPISEMMQTDTIHTPLQDITSSSILSSTPELVSSSGVKNYSSNSTLPPSFTSSLDMSSQSKGTTSEEKIKFHKEKAEALRRKVKILQSRLRRREKKLTNLTSLIKL